MYNVMVSFRGVAQLVARDIWDVEAAGSNPVTPTSRVPRHAFRASGRFYFQGFLPRKKIYFIYHRQSSASTRISRVEALLFSGFSPALKNLFYTTDSRVPRHAFRALRRFCFPGFLPRQKIFFMSTPHISIPAKRLTEPFGGCFYLSDPQVIIYTKYHKKSQKTAVMGVNMGVKLFLLIKEQKLMRRRICLADEYDGIFL